MCNIEFNNIMFVKVFKSFFNPLDDLFFQVHKFLDNVHFWSIEHKHCQGLPSIFDNLSTPFFTFSTCDIYMIPLFDS